jgi:hypothetical protein
MRSGLRSPFRGKQASAAITAYTASRSVSAGDHVLSVEYYEHTEVAVARLAISP